MIPSLKYRDIVEGLSDVTKPSVPDFGFAASLIAFDDIRPRVHFNLDSHDFPLTERAVGHSVGHIPEASTVSSARGNYWRIFYRDIILQKKYETIDNYITNRQEEIRMSHERERQRKKGKNNLRQLIVESIKEELTIKAIENVQR